MNSARYVGGSMGLDAEQTHYLLELPPRTAVLFYPGYSKAFMFKVAELDFSKKPANEALVALMSPILAGLKWLRRDEATSNLNTQVINVPIPNKQIDYLAKLSQPQHHFLPVSKLAELFKLSAYKENAIRARLEEPGYIKTHKMSFGRHGSIALIEILDKGYDYLDCLGVKYSKPRGKGSFLHKFWQWRACSRLRTRFPNANVQIEDGSNGKSVDVSLHLASLEGSNSIACEILIQGETKDAVNVIKDWQAGYSGVVVCA